MNQDLLHKYLSGSCSPEEKQVVEEWLNEFPKKKKLMKELKRIWKVTPGRRIKVDSLEAWNLFRKHHLEHREGDEGTDGDEINFNAEEGSNTSRHNRGRRRTISRVVAYTVAAAAVVLIAFLFSNTISFSPEPAEPELLSQKITTEKGQRTTVRLSDGTQIVLNAESKLRVPEDYMDENRDVYLEGEAFFDVVSNKRKPFIVHTDRSVTRVLGTKFNVTAYPDAREVQVVVARGKVSLQSSGKLQAPEVQLARSQRGVISKDGKIIASTVSDISVYTDWSRGRLTFRDASLEEVQERLERWYDIEVVVVDEISTRDRLLTGSFEDVPLSGVLNSIALSLDLNYKRDGKKVTFEMR